MNNDIERLARRWAERITAQPDWKWDPGLTAGARTPESGHGDLIKMR